MGISKKVTSELWDPELFGTPKLLTDLIARARQMSQSNKPEYLFEEERHPDIGGYEKTIINGENNSIGS